MTILKYPDPLLLQPCQPVELTPEVKAWIKAFGDFLIKPMEWGFAAGMAANQVGKPWRIFMANGHLYINPEITWKPVGGEKAYKEGCFSLQENKFDYPTLRAYSLMMKWQDIKGEWHTSRFNGLQAQVILHEYDHISGVMCCQARQATGDPEPLRSIIEE